MTTKKIELVTECVRCAKQGPLHSPLHFCPACHTYFRTQAYIDGHRIGKYGDYCRAHYFNGERMMVTSFSLSELQAFCPDAHMIPKRELPGMRKKWHGEMTEQQFYRELYLLECQDRGFFVALAKKEEPLF